MAVSEPSELNLWTRQWRDERIRKARADFRERDAAWHSLKDKSTDYARSIKVARDVCAQVLALWEGSPVDLPADDSGVMVCATEQDCTGMPWCRINGKCQRTAGVEGMSK